MVKEKVGLDDVRELALTYKEARLKELRIKRELARAESELAELEKLTVNRAYQNGSITGSNKQKRDAEEAAVLAASEEVQGLRGIVTRLSEAADVAQVDAEAARLHAGLVKAWLYAQAGLE
jgi:hypothetical protein